MSTSRPRVVIVVTSPLALRKVYYSSFLGAALPRFDVELWCTGEPGPPPEQDGLEHFSLRPFPAVRPSATPGKNLLRNLNDVAWDQHLRLPGKVDLWRSVPGRREPRRRRLLRPPAWLLSKLGLRGPLDRFVRFLLQRERMSPEAHERFEAKPPDLVLLTWPHSWYEQAVGREAMRLGIPVVGQILSFDNLTTKPRFHVAIGKMLVWSEAMRAELTRIHPAYDEARTTIVGTPQFDPFYDPAHQLPRAVFCEQHGLDPDHPIVLYTLGSPNVLDELPGAVATAEALLAGRLGPSTQMLIRPHPLFDYGHALNELGRRSQRIGVQTTGTAGLPVTDRHQLRAQITAWVSTFRHADVVVNLGSTTTLDAAAADTPVVNLDFEPSGAGTHDALIHSVNHTWPHFAALNRSGGLALVSDYEQLFESIRCYLEDPARDRAARHQMAVDVLGPLDGQAGARTASALADALGNTI